jgi:hypothetical protein
MMVMDEKNFLVKEFKDYYIIYAEEKIIKKNKKKFSYTSSNNSHVLSVNEIKKIINFLNLNNYH